MDDEYIVLDEEDEDIFKKGWINKAQQAFLREVKEMDQYDLSKGMSGFLSPDTKYSTPLSLEPCIRLPESIGFVMNNEEILGAKLHTDLDNNSKYLRVHINNSYPTCLKFKKKPTWIQRIFLKALGIKFALEG